MAEVASDGEAALGSLQGFIEAPQFHQRVGEVAQGGREIAALGLAEAFELGDGPPERLERPVRAAMGVKQPAQIKLAQRQL